MILSETHIKLQLVVMSQIVFQTISHYIENFFEKNRCIRANVYEQICF